MEFQYSFDASPKPMIDPNATLYASVAGMAADLGNGECVFRTADGPHVMTTQVLGALDRCRAFKSIDEHIQTIRQILPNVPLDGIKRVLDGLVGRRLLISESDYLHNLEASAAATSQPGVDPTLVIRACDRPAALKQCLSSLQQSAAVQGLPVQLIDDSRDTGAQREHQQLLADSGLNARAFDADTAIAKLKRALPEHQAVIADLFAGHGNGRAFNRALLATAGRTLALLDDDFVYRMHRHPEFKAGLDLALSSNLPVRFFDQLPAALEAGQEDASAFADHQRRCGQSLAGLLQIEGLGNRKGALRGLEPSNLPHLSAGARIVATVNGHRGRSGSTRCEGFFEVDAASRASFVATRERYLRSIENPALWVGPTKAHLARRVNFLPFLVDTTDMLGFAAPTGRSEDAFFGAMTQLLLPESLVWMSAHAIAHQPPEERKFPKPGAEVERPGFNTFLVDYALNRVGDLRAASVTQRAAGFAGMLEDLADCEQRALLQFVAEYLQFRRSDLIHSLQGIAAEAGPQAPVFWQADLREIIVANGKALAQNELPRLAGEQAFTTAEALTAHWRNELRRHAAAVRAWPVIWQAALQGVAR